MRGCCRSRRRSRRPGRVRGVRSARRRCGSRRRSTRIFRPSNGRVVEAVVVIPLGRRPRRFLRGPVVGGDERERAFGRRSGSSSVGGGRRETQREEDRERAALDRACSPSVISPPSSPTSSRLIDRPEAGAAVEAGGRAVALGERLEDAPLCCSSSMPMPVSRDREREHRRRCDQRFRSPWLQPLSGRSRRAGAPRRVR